jgi:hypothetical protein
LVLVGFVVMLGACGTQEEGSGSTSSRSNELKVDAAEIKTTSLVTKEMVAAACEILTPTMVAHTFGVDEASLRQDKIMGCIYSANANGLELEARLSMLKAHESPGSAATWFENATRSMSKDDVVQFMRGVSEDAKKREEIDTKTKEKVVDDMGGLLASTVGEDGIQYEPLSGLGDAARVNTSEGSLWLRKGNLTFLVAAYYGPKQPAPNLAGVPIKDMAKAAMKASKDWTKETLPQRRADASKLALAIVEAIPR